MTANISHIYNLADTEKENINGTGELELTLSQILNAKIQTPECFIITSSAYREFIEQNNLNIKIPQLLSHINLNQTESIQSTSENIKRLFLNGLIDQDLIANIFRRYEQINGILNNNLFSLTIETIPANLHHPAPKPITPFWGEANMLLKIKEAWASSFSPEAILFRKLNNLNHFKFGISLVVQKVINSTASGVFSENKLRTGEKELTIKAQLGIYNPGLPFDEYKLLISNSSITNKTVIKQIMMSKISDNKIKRVKIPKILQEIQKISDKNIYDIFKLNSKLQTLFYLPKEYSFGIEKSHIYISNIKPKTTLNPEYELLNERKLGTGIPSTKGLGTGEARIINTLADLKKVNQREVLILKKVLPGLKDIMSKCAGLIFQEKLERPHIHHLLNNNSVPIVSNFSNIIVIKNGQVLTVNGTIGYVAKGGPLAKTATKTYLDLSNNLLNDNYHTDLNYPLYMLSGNSLIKSIGIHPKSFILNNKNAKFISLFCNRIENILRQQKSKSLIYTLSDLQTTALKSLKEGKSFETFEENPYIGFRGSIRNIRDKLPFLLELSALKNLNETLNYNNLHLVLPFTRSVKELKHIKQILVSENILKSKGFIIWMKISTPMQAINISEFIYEGMDGIFIDLDSLYTLLIGVDEMNSELFDSYEDTYSGFESYLEGLINSIKKYNISINIYGSKFLMHEKLLAKLVKLGISSIIVNPTQSKWAKEIIKKTEMEIININP